MFSRLYSWNKRGLHVQTQKQLAIEAQQLAESMSRIDLHNDNEVSDVLTRLSLLHTPLHSWFIINQHVTLNVLFERISDIDFNLRVNIGEEHEEDIRLFTTEVKRLYLRKFLQPAHPEHIWSNAELDRVMMCKEGELAKAVRQLGVQSKSKPLPVLAKVRPARC
eukprot:c7190_g1_i1.p1 GENE.c7190_g1_i1~~c7190_g1_i1.p1  ORF type:complete len:164 (-),score=51.01 c7190_g1_i1:402-893(-)